MKTPILTTYTFKTGDQQYTQSQIVLVNSRHKNEEALEKATSAVVDTFPKRYPESELLSVTATPTIQL